MLVSLDQALVLAVQVAEQAVLQAVVLVAVVASSPVGVLVDYSYFEHIYPLRLTPL